VTDTERDAKLLLQLSIQLLQAVIMGLSMAELTTCAASHSTERVAVRAAWWAVVARFLIHGLVASAWISRIPAVQSQLGLNNAALGLSLLGTAVGSVASIPLTGWFVTRFGSKRATTWSTVAFCVALVGPTFATGPVSLFALLVVYGAAAGANDVSMNSQAVAVEEALNAPTMSRFHAMFSIGAMAGATIGGIAAAHQIMPRAHLAIVSAILLILSGVTSPMLLEAGDAARKTEQRLRIRRLPPAVIPLAIVGFSMFLSEGAMADWAAIFMKQDLFAGAGMAAAGYAIFSAGMAAFRLSGDAVTKRLGPVLTARTGALLAAAGLTFALLSRSPQWALPGFAVSGAGFSVIVPLVFAAGGRVPGIQRGLGVALVSGSGYIGFLFGPPFIGLASQWFTLRTALFFIVGLCLVGAALSQAVAPAQSRA
jgi:MFS family permease